mgnify:CR=1 FL=1
MAPKARKPSTRAKPVRRPPVAIPTIDVRLLRIEDWIIRIEDRLDRLINRIDRMADALAPALRLWKNIRARLPRWLLPEDRELAADDSENE